MKKKRKKINKKKLKKSNSPKSKKILKKKRKKIKKKIKVNLGLSKQLNYQNIIINFFLYTIFSLDFYNEIKNIFLKKNFFIKLKMIIMEFTQAQICYKWIKKEKLFNSNNTILYSFWSNYILLSFEKLKKEKPNVCTISRTLGSDLNGYLKNDNYVPFIDKKFHSLNLLFVLANYQKQKILKQNLIDKNKIVIAPLGIYKTTNLKKKIKFSTLNFLSCNNFIKIKNTLTMIEFIKYFSKFSKIKVNYNLIGSGNERNKIINKLKNYSKYFSFKVINNVKNLQQHIKKNNIHFFMNFSSKEGMSFTIMEALGIGIPVISSDIEANINLVNNDRGYLIKLHNTNNSFKVVSNKIINDVNNKKRYLSKKKNAYKFIKKNLINKKCYTIFEKKIVKLQ